MNRFTWLGIGIAACLAAAWLYAPLRLAAQDEGGSGEKQEQEAPLPPPLFDPDGDGELTQADLDALYLAIEKPEAFEAAYGLSAKDVWLLVDTDQDGVVTEDEIAAFTSAPPPEYAGDSGEKSGESAPLLPNGGFCEGGHARRWEAELPVSPFSYVNMRSGNLLTEVALVAFDPVGPPVGFAVYHNSLATSCSNMSGATGFSMGAGWSCSYSARVEGNAGQNITVVHDDGTRDVYTYSGGTYTPPAGVFDQLSYNGTWSLTHPNLWVETFDSNGRLTGVQDSAGNAVVVHRDASGKIDYVASAAEALGGGNHRLTFSYAGSQLIAITDPIGRSWTFTCDASSRLWNINYPVDNWVTASFVRITYGLGNRISTVTSRDSKTWTYAYNASTYKISTVTDPAPFNYTQTCSFATSPIGGLYTNSYTDRRAKTWYFRFDTSQNLRQLQNPRPGIPNVRYFTYDASHNRLTATDELSHTWTATYNAYGRVQTVTSPLPGTPAQTWTLTWEHPSGTPANFYRLTQVTDPAGDWAQYGYGGPSFFDQTLVTSVVEMAAEQGGSTATTTLEYYGVGTPSAKGQLWKVTDANGVQHRYEYDQSWGYFTHLTEGLFSGDDPVNPFEVHQQCDAVGRVTQAWGEYGGGNRTLDVNNNDRPASGGAPARCDEFGPTTPERLGDVPLDTPDWTPMFANLTSAAYDTEGRLLSSTSAVNGPSDINGLSLGLGFDGLGRVTYRERTATIGTAPYNLTRRFDYGGYDANGNLLSRNGPDEQDTYYTYDEAGHLKTITRNTLSAEYFYDAAGRIDHINYGNGASEWRTYDNANRLLTVQHKDAAAVVRFEIDYIWNLDNTVYTRTEIDSTAQPSHTSETTFTYDHRKRLRTEERILDGTTTVYNLEYQYDQLGNRTRKIDGVNGQTTDYSYDISNPEPGYQTRNNRLVKYEVKNAQQELLRTVRYVYFKSGDVANVNIKDEWTGQGEAPPEYAWYYDLTFGYDRYGHVWRVLHDKWTLDQYGQPDQYTKLSLREFYYDSGRARWLDRDVDVDSLEPVGTQRGTDYDADQPYGDFTFTPGQVPVDQTRYLDGLGPQAKQSATGTASTYFHGDLIRSTMLTTDSNGGASSAAVYAYTAFGEPVGTADPTGTTRYGYAGGYGYESGLLELVGANAELPPITLQHVGARCYDPALGRFVQRDPIGMRGGLNVYVYCMVDPLTGVDPQGMSMGPWPWWFGPEWGRFGDQRLIWSAGKTIGHALKMLNELGADRALWRTVLQRAQAVRNAAFGRLLGPLCIIVAVCHVSAAAAEAANPYIEEASEGYAGWTQGGRAGLDPRGLLDLPRGRRLNPPWNKPGTW